MKILLAAATAVTAVAATLYWSYWDCFKRGPRTEVDWDWQADLDDDYDPLTVLWEEWLTEGERM